MVASAPEHPQPDSFAAGLRAWREACRLSRPALAEQAHCSVAMLRQIEAGTRRPSADLAAQFARALPIPASVHSDFIAWARGDGVPPPQVLPPPAYPRTTMLHLPPLPVNLPSFVGREAEVRAVAAAVNGDTVRLATLTGPGGVGKTRLALAAAEAAHPAFPDGVAFVALAALTDPALVPSEIARVLGIPEAADRPLLATLQAALAPRRLLLVLDNLEQLPAVSLLVDALLAACAHLRILATSREPLRLPGEQVVAVLPLPVPDPSVLPAHDELGVVPAVALFVARAQASRPDFRLTAANASAVAAICTRLDGLPLALELAAARVRLLSPEALLVRLAQCLDLLVDAAGRRPARHQTLRATIAWSYDLLPPPEQTLFCRLAVFAGGATLEAAEAVAGYDAAFDCRVLIESLAEKSLVGLQETPAPAPPADAAEPGTGGPRWGLLETIREYALRLLRERGDEAALRYAHAAYFLALAETAEPQLEGAARRAWLDRLEAEHDNFRSALDWALTYDPPLGLRLVGALWPFWWGQGHWQEGRARLAAVLAASPDPTAARAKALQGAGTLAYTLGDTPAEQAYHEEGLAIYQALGDSLGTAALLLDVASLRRDEGDYDAAIAMCRESLALYQAAANYAGQGRALIWLGDIYQAQGDYAASAQVLEQSRAIYQASGSDRGMAWALSSLGEVARYEARYHLAQELYAESIALCRKLGDRLYLAIVLHNCAYSFLDNDQPDQARTLFLEALDTAAQHGATAHCGWCLAGLGAVFAQQGAAYQAAQLLGAAQAVLAACGARLAPLDAATVERYTRQAQHTLSPDAWESAWATGQSWPLARAIHQARQLVRPPPDPRRHEGMVSDTGGATTGELLTQREREVLRLITIGLSNEEVAARLCISLNTVRTHTRAIYSKLGVTSRTAATRAAFDRRLV